MQDNEKLEFQGTGESGLTFSKLLCSMFYIFQWDCVIAFHKAVHLDLIQISFLQSGQDFLKGCEMVKNLSWPRNPLDKFAETFVQNLLKLL